MILRFVSAECSLWLKWTAFSVGTTILNRPVKPQLYQLCKQQCCCSLHENGKPSACLESSGHRLDTCRLSQVVLSGQPDRLDASKLPPKCSVPSCGTHVFTNLGGTAGVRGIHCWGLLSRRVSSFKGDTHSLTFPARPRASKPQGRGCKAKGGMPWGGEGSK